MSLFPGTSLWYHGRSMQRKFAVIGGTHLLNMPGLARLEQKNISTPHGTAEVDVAVLRSRSIVLIRRHGRANDKPPHRIPYAANFAALKSLDVTHVLALGSTGCLKDTVRLPALIVPDDYIDFSSGATVFEKELVHVTPGFDDELRAALIQTARQRSPHPVLDRGVYVQTRGPRLETRAEISFLRTLGDCVGMTVAGEASVARELGLGYAALCTMDNYAHGIRGQVPDYQDIAAQAQKLADLCLDIVVDAIERLSA